jgi:cation diffusion facilitator family transporter
MTENQSKNAEKAGIVSLISNLILTIIKALVGIFGNSYALIADAIESATDVFTSAFVIFGIKYANKPADDNHPYGHGKIEPLITFLVVLFLISSATLIAYQSIVNIQTPHQSPAWWTIPVLTMIIIWKEISYRYLIQKSKETKGNILKAEAWHHRSDAITSFAALIGISIAVYFGAGFEAADDWAALLASGFIYYNSYLIFRPALGELLDEHLYEDMVVEIRKTSLKVNGVINTEKCYIRKVGFHYFVDLHAIVDAHISVKDGHEISHRLKDQLLAEIPQIKNVLIHIEPHEF